MGFANRTLVLIDEDGMVPLGRYESPDPGEFPGADVIFDAVCQPTLLLYIDGHMTATRAMTDLTSAAVPPVGPRTTCAERGRLVIYADLGCPRCAGAWTELRARRNRLAFRHLPSPANSRAPAARAAEAAGGRMVLFAHGPDLLTPIAAGSTTRISGSGAGAGSIHRFEAHRRSEAVARGCDAIFSPEFGRG